MQLKQCNCANHVGDRQVPVELFYKHASRPDGLSHSCKVCTNRQMAVSRAKNPDANCQVRRQYYQRNVQAHKNRTKRNYDAQKNTKEFIAKQLLRNATTRAKSKGIVINISVEDIVVPDACPILGIPLIRSDGVATDNSPTIDRIDPNLGYIKGNIHVISKRANVIKSYGTPEDHKLIYEYFSGWSNETG